MRPTVIITTHNEGDELQATIVSARKSAPECEIIVVDDASTDGSTEGLHLVDVLARNTERLGVAPSRHRGVSLAHGDSFMFLDAHCRIENDAITKCGELAVTREAITWCGIKGFNRQKRWTGRGGSLCQKDKPEHRYSRGWFANTWRSGRYYDSIGRFSGLVCPGYTIPRTVYSKVKWCEGLGGWGLSEAAVNVKAFFTQTDMLYLEGPIVRHKFKKKFHYRVSMKRMGWNCAVIARICFSDGSWSNYWRPLLKKRIGMEGIAFAERLEITEQRDEFRRIKCVPDTEFWCSLQHCEPPGGIVND